MFSNIPEDLCVKFPPWPSLFTSFPPSYFSITTLLWSSRCEVYLAVKKIVSQQSNLYIQVRATGQGPKRSQEDGQVDTEREREREEREREREQRKHEDD